MKKPITILQEYKHATYNATLWLVKRKVAMKRVGNMLKEVRRELGLPQEEFAALLSFSTAYYRRIEDGSRLLAPESIPYLEAFLLGDPTQKEKR